MCAGFGTWAAAAPRCVEDSAPVDTVPVIADIQLGISIVGISMLGISIQPMEALGCSNIVRKIMLFFPPSILINLQPPLLEAYLKQITQLTCHFMKAATQKDSV